MMSAFRERPEVNRRVMCDIDGVQSRVTQSHVKKWEVLAKKYTDHLRLTYTFHRSTLLVILLVTK